MLLETKDFRPKAQVRHLQALTQALLIIAWRTAILTFMRRYYCLLAVADGLIPLGDRLTGVLPGGVCRLRKPERFQAIVIGQTIQVFLWQRAKGISQQLLRVDIRHRRNERRCCAACWVS